MREKGAKAPDSFLGTADISDSITRAPAPSVHAKLGTWEGIQQIGGMYCLLKCCMGILCWDYWTGKMIMVLFLIN